MFFEKEVDPFADNYGESNKVHIRVQQREKRQKKCCTYIEGLGNDINDKDTKKDLKKILKKFKRDFACNGNLMESEEDGFIIKLQGDHRDEIKKILISNDLVSEENITIHGY